MVNLRGDHADFPDRDRRSAEAAGDADAHRGGGGYDNYGGGGSYGGGYDDYGGYGEYGALF